MSVSNILTKPKAFVSYSHSSSDPHWVNNFVRSLKDAGIEVWFDQDEIKAGDLWEDYIEKGLRESNVIIFLLTKDHIHSANSLFELGASIATGKRIIGIVSEDLDRSLLPQPFRIRKYLEIKSPEETAAEVISAVMEN
jgi:hypothetical protein